MTKGLGGTQCAYLRPSHHPVILEHVPAYLCGDEPLEMPHNLKDPVYH